MLRIIVKYGIISGIAQGALMILSAVLFNKIGYTYAEGLGYVCAILGFLPVFFGVIKYRDTEGGGALSFGRASLISLCAGLIASVFYVGSWLLVYYTMPEFMEKVTAFSIQQMKNASRPQKEIDDMLAQIKEAKEVFKNNPFIPAAYKYMNTIPGNVVFALITGLLTMRKKPGLPLQQGNGLLS